MYQIQQSQFVVDIFLTIGMGSNVTLSDLAFVKMQSQWFDSKS